MVAASILSLAALAGIAVALPASAPRNLHFDQRGLKRLTNSTLAGRAIMPGSFRGVNLGSWLLSEPYMNIDEWHNEMGGDWLCGDCTQCVNDDFSLTARLGQDQANTVYAKHYDSFINQDDVNLMKQYGINSVRIPLGFWIIEETVNPDETYPRGGLDFLRSRSKMFKEAGISILLDLHAAPGAQIARNSFTGRCVESPQFWQPSNFDRMNRAAAKLTELVHAEPDNFGSVWGLQALNEPPSNTAETPGYWDFMNGFNAAVRNKENDMGIADDQRISAVYMDVSWQWQGDSPANAAYVANGGNAYDSHVYYSFGAPCGNNGCVEENLQSHINFACQGGGGRIENDAKVYNTPSFLGEFWIMPLGNTCNAFDKDCIRAFGDAQKRGYSPEGGHGGAGWYFWSWKMTNSDQDGSNHLRSYKDAVQQGYLPENAADYFNAGICG